MPPEWIDYNGHMNDAYYFMAFTEATEAFLDHVGLGAAYRARTGSGIYTAESHLCFLSGVVGGAVLAYQTQLLGHDAKRLHVFHRMSDSGTLVATCELMFLHVSGERVAPMPPEAVAAVDALALEQATLPRPERAGRRVAMPQRVLRVFTERGLRRGSCAAGLARGPFYQGGQCWAHQGHCGPGHRWFHGHAQAGGGPCGGQRVWGEADPVGGAPSRAGEGDGAACVGRVRRAAGLGT